MTVLVHQVQEILYWQTATMKMMYRYIAVAIEEEGLDTHPTDYLSFYCIGKRALSYLTLAIRLGTGEQY